VVIFILLVVSIYNKKVGIKMDLCPLDAKTISEGLKGTVFSKVLVLDEIDSTNELAKRMIKEKPKEEILIVAENQTCGKGRMKRRWWSKKYSNLLFSLLLSPKIHKSLGFSLNMAIAVSFVEAIKEKYDIDVMIKWPNDLYIRNKKLAGILMEFFLQGDLLSYVVVGMGINVNWAPENTELIYPATCLAREKNMYIKREPLLIEGLKKFNRYYKEILNNKVEELYEKWQEKCMILGKEVLVREQDREIKGTALRVEKDGSLIIKVQDKELKVLFGDVSLR
jgi:BirA family biotin operon repressor/biotin-[acetyl-CoA-carboxylase] ligase